MSRQSRHRVNGKGKPRRKIVAVAGNQPNLYGQYGYYPRYYGYYPHYPAVAGYWDYYRTSWPGRGNDEESTR
jgi:hypothetical protein